MALFVTMMCKTVEENNPAYTKECKDKVAPFRLTRQSCSNWFKIPITKMKTGVRVFCQINLYRQCGLTEGLEHSFFCDSDLKCT